jgi:hypothetical protein
MFNKISKLQSSHYRNIYETNGNLLRIPQDGRNILCELVA